MASSSSSSRMMVPPMHHVDVFIEKIYNGDATNSDGVLSYLADSLRGPMPKGSLPAAIKAYYTGPSARKGGYQAERPESPPKQRSGTSRESQRASEPQDEDMTSPVNNTEVKKGHRLRTDRASIRARAKTARLAPLSKSTDNLFHSSLIPPASIKPEALGQASSRPQEEDEEDEVVDIAASRASSHASLGGLSNTSKSTKAALPSIPSKFAAGLNDVMLKAYAAESLRQGPSEGIWPTGGRVSLNSARSFRSFRQKQSDSMKQYQQQSIAPVLLIKIPTAPTQVLTSSLGAGKGAERSEDVPSWKRSQMRQIVDLLKSFQGLDDRLKDTLAECFRGFEYAPGSILIQKGVKAREAHVLLSGQAILYGNQDGSGPSRRLLPGAVIGLELMLAGRQESPGTVTTDLNFPSLVATISWDDYDAVISKWAAQQLVSLMPSLQLSMEIRFRKEIEERCKVVKKSPGEALYLQGQVAEDILILLKGSVLTCHTDSSTIQTESQVVGQLQSGLGPTRLSAPPDAPTKKSQPASLLTIKKSGGLKFKTEDKEEEGEGEGGDLGKLTSASLLTLASEGRKKRGGLKKAADDNKNSLAPTATEQPSSSHPLPTLQPDPTLPSISPQPQVDSDKAKTVSTQDDLKENKGDEGADIPSPPPLESALTSSDEANVKRPGSSLKSRIEGGALEHTLHLQRGLSPLPPPPPSTSASFKRLSSSSERAPSVSPVPPVKPISDRAHSISLLIPEGAKKSKIREDFDEAASVVSRRSHHSEYRSIGRGTSIAGETEASVAPEEDIGSIPLYNAMSTQFKIFKQALSAVYQRGGLVLGEEALEDQPDKFNPSVHTRTAIAFEPCSYVVIPRKVLLQALGQTPSTEMLLDELRKKVAHEQLLKQGSHGISEEANVPTKEERDETLRRYLKISPAARPLWQVEALADAFSLNFPHLFTKMNWQARLKFFQEVKIKEIEVNEPILLSKSEMALEQISELPVMPDPVVAPPVTGGFTSLASENGANHLGNLIVSGGPLHGWEAPSDPPRLSLQEDNMGQMVGREFIDPSYLDKFKGYDITRMSDPTPLQKIKVSDAEVARASDPPPSPSKAPPRLELPPPLSSGAPPSPSKATPSSPAKQNHQKSNARRTLVPCSPHASADDHVYFIITGGVSLQLSHTPISSPNDDVDATEGNILKPLTLLRPGEIFSSSTLSSLANNETLSRLTLPLPKDKEPQSWELGATQTFQASASPLSPLSPRTRREASSSSKAAKAEVLHLPRLMMDMISSSGKALSVDQIVDEAVFEKTFWWGLVCGEGPRQEKMSRTRSFARFLTTRLEKDAIPRAHDFKQGTELLRRSESASCLIVVLKGECVLRGNHVGLLEAHAGSSVHSTDLGILHVGQSVGELSLLSDRPLWYNLIVKSSMATVLLLDLGTLRSYFEEEGDAEKLVLSTMEEDRRLYAIAVQKQAMLIQAGSLDLSLFSSAMKRLLRQLMAMGNLNASEIQMHFMSREDAEDGGARLLPNSYTPVVLDASKITHAITTIVGSVARPESYSSVTNHDRETLREMAKHVAAQGVVMSDLTLGSSVTANGAQGGLRVTMPTPNPHERSYQAPTRLRRPLMVEKPSVPRSLKGGEIELSRFSAANAMGSVGGGGPEMMLGLFGVESAIAGINISVHLPNRDAIQPPMPSSLCHPQPKHDESLNEHEHFPAGRPPWSDDNDEEKEEDIAYLPDPLSPHRRHVVHHTLMKVDSQGITDSNDYSSFLVEEETDAHKPAACPDSSVSFLAQAHPDIARNEQSSAGSTRARNMRSSPSFGRMASFSSRKIIQSSPVIKPGDGDNEEDDEDPLIRRLLLESVAMNQSRSSSPRRSSQGYPRRSSQGGFTVVSPPKGPMPASASIPTQLTRKEASALPPLSPISTSEANVATRELWVRNQVHDPSGLTNAHLGRLVTDAARKVHGGQQLPPVKVAQPAFVAAANNKPQTAASIARQMLKVSHRPKLPAKRDPFLGTDGSRAKIHSTSMDDEEGPSQSVENLMEQESMFLTMATPPKVDDLTGPDPLGLNKTARLRNEMIQRQAQESRQKEDEARMALAKRDLDHAQLKPRKKEGLLKAESFDVPAFSSVLGFTAGMEVHDGGPGGMIYFN